MAAQKGNWSWFQFTLFLILTLIATVLTGLRFVIRA